LDANHKFLDETKTPSLVKWAERFCDDPAVKPIMRSEASSLQPIRGLNIQPIFDK